MRKFKFMSKAVVGMMAVAMTMGSLSGVAARQPMGVYAQGGADEDSEAPATLTFNYGTATFDFTKGNAITAVNPVLPSDYELATDKTVTVTPSLPVGITSTDGVIAGMPTEVVEPKEYTISFKIIKTAEKADQTKAVVATAKINLSVNGDGSTIKLAAPTMPTAAFTKGSAITAINIPTATTGANDIEGYELVGFPKGLSVNEVKEEETVTGYQISGTPSEVTPAGTGYIKAMGVDDSDNQIALAWIAADFPEVKDSTSGENPPTPGATTETNVDPDYTTYTLKITGDPAAKYAFLEVWKLEKDATNFNTAAGSKDKLSNTYSYELTNGTVTVDLSFLKAGTIQALKVYTDKNTTKKPIILSAQPGKLSGLKYNSATKEFDISKAKEGKEGLKTFDKTLYEYRGQYGSTWTPLEDIINVDHISAGSTIIIRKEATATAPAGPEAKVKISAAGKAPKVTLDYKKGTIKLSEKLEYAGNGKAYVAGTKDAMTLETLRTNLGVSDPTQELVVYVRTKEDTGKGKAASNATCVIIPGEEVLADTNSTIAVAGDAENKVTYAADTKGSGKSAKPIYKFTVKGSGFEFTTVATGDRKWKAVGDGKDYTVEQTEAAQTVYIRKAGVKGKAKDGSDSFFPSKEIPVTVPAKSADAGDKATKPTLGNAGEVKVDGELVLTISRDQTTNTTIKFTKAEGKDSVVGTLEYRIGTGEYADIPSEPLTGKGTEKITVQVRIKKTDDKAASDPLDVEIAAVGGAQKMDTPTIVVATGKVSVGSAEVATISRDASDDLIKIVAATDKNDVIEYSVDGGTTWANVTGNVSVAGSSAITSVQLRTKAADSKSVSDALTVGVPKNLATSDVTIARKAEPADGTTIVFTVDSSITATLEYKIGSEAWAEIPSSKEVASVATTQLGIKVRVKAVDNNTAKNLASNELSITVNAK